MKPDFMFNWVDLIKNVKCQCIMIVTYIIICSSNTGQKLSSEKEVNKESFILCELRLCVPTREEHFTGCFRGAAEQIDKKNLINPTRNSFTSIREFQTLNQGRMALPNRMNFWKTSKGEGGHFQSRNLYCRFWAFREALIYENSKKTDNCPLWVTPPPNV